MRYFAALTLALAVAGGVRAIAPPVEPPPSPVIVPSPPPIGPNILPVDPGTPSGPPALNTPEPTTLTIAGMGMAAAGAYRLLRRGRKT